MTIILCILLAAVCAGLGLWVWTQYRALKEAAEQLRELTQGDSTARLRMAVPNRAAEELLEGVNLLLELRREDQSRWLERERSLAELGLLLAREYGLPEETARADAAGFLQPALERNVVLRC